MSEIEAMRPKVWAMRTHAGESTGNIPYSKKYINKHAVVEDNLASQPNIMLHLFQGWLTSCRMEVRSSEVRRSVSRSRSSVATSLALYWELFDIVPNRNESNARKV